MEGLELTCFSDIYRGRRVMVTGHTGFKGSWLVNWLVDLGAKVTGISLAPGAFPNHWDLLDLSIDSVFVDIRDSNALERAIEIAKPEIIFHLAAQALVRHSYLEPLETWQTNVIGTVNLLEAARQVPGVLAVVVVTTDKCYENREWLWGYREIDPLGGHDPYSASKAGAELVAQSYRRSFTSLGTGPLIATARAGNVIGGGDWAPDRLIPDFVRCAGRGEALLVRSPSATRPWQHVLEPLSGYLLLGQRLLEGRTSFAEAWNFGPGATGNRSVSWILDTMHGLWPALSWNFVKTDDLHEAQLLQLDCSKAAGLLNWAPVWDIETCLQKTIEWYRAFLEQEVVLTGNQLADFQQSAIDAGATWIRP